MSDMTFCSQPGNCPVQYECKRNEHLWKTKPPVRIYSRFQWNEADGCQAFLQVDDKFSSNSQRTG